MSGAVLGGIHLPERAEVEMERAGRAAGRGQQEAVEPFQLRTQVDRLTA